MHHTSHVLYVILWKMYPQTPFKVLPYRNPMGQAGSITDSNLQGICRSGGFWLQVMENPIYTMVSKLVILNVGKGTVKYTLSYTVCWQNYKLIQPSSKAN